ncbi:MAG: hypothetical protein ACYC46_09950 [Acidobacteriaceae bacterium]
MPPVEVAPSPIEIAQNLEEFLADHPRAVLLEDGRVLFDMQLAHYSLSTEHSRCTLHLWSDERNIVRRVVGVRQRKDVLKLATMRFGQSRPQTMELVADRDRRTPTTREATRRKYLPLLQRILLRNFPDWKADGFRTAMDLERSFGPAYARGMLLRGTSAWAVIAVNAEESQATVDGILTLGILWLAHCRERAGGRRLFSGLKIIVPSGMAALTLSRLAWLNPQVAQWELYELDERSEELVLCDPADSGNLSTHIVHAPNVEATRERFAAASEYILGLLPERMRPLVEQRVRTSTEMAFLWHGLEFARVRMGLSPNSFERVQEMTFGTGQYETTLNEESEATFADMLQRVYDRRHASGDTRDVIYRMQPERWLETVLRENLCSLEKSIEPHLDSDHIYTQVPAFSAADRGMLDMLARTRDGRLVVLELKASEDLHLALQGLDYWVRVRWHQLQPAAADTGLGEFQRHGYFPGVAVAAEAPKLYLVAPALHIHPATETVLKHLSPAVEWSLIALDERWRKEVKAVFRKRSTDRSV